MNDKSTKVTYIDGNIEVEYQNGEEIFCKILSLNEVTDLISVRQYIANSINNGSLDRPTISMLNGMLILMDMKIIEMLKSNEFKEYIGFRDVRKAIEETARITNIKSGLKK